MPGARKLSLYQKGLWVIGLLLAFQFAFLEFYASWLHDAEFLTEQEFHNKEVVGRCNWIAALLSSSSSAWLAYHLTHDKTFLTLYQKSDANLAKQLSGFEESAGQDQEQRQRAANAVAVIEKTRQDMHSHQVDQQEWTTILKDQYLPRWNELYRARHQFLEAELQHYKVLEDSLPWQRQFRNEQVQVLIVLNVLIAAGLFYLYTSGMTRRIAVLSENATRFAQRQPLHPAVGGSDEITDLDKSFHSMADSLRLAEKRKQEMLSMISHDMRTPLTSVQTSLEFVLEKHPQDLPDDARNWVNMASDNVQTVLQLINELLEIERIDAGLLTLELSEVEIIELAQRAITTVQSIADKKGITIVAPSKNAFVEGDEERLLRVLVNLLGNAIKFSPPHSTITVGCEVSVPWLILTVQDEGRGIPADQLRTIFESFQQVKLDDARKLGGSGLGLAISKAIVEAHGGTISASSEQAKGSTFTIQLPYKS